jgi:nucleoside-diphosphate-sugar epimerase
MQVFLTGASGYIGNAVARALRRAGHEVLGLVRSSEAAAQLWSDEVRPIIGDLKSPESYATAARNAEVLVHAAEDPVAGPSLDRAVIEHLLLNARGAGRERTVVYTSGVWIYGDTRGGRVTESSALDPLPEVAWRPEHEALVLHASSELVSTIVLRPGCVYGGRAGMTAAWFEGAQKGRIRVVGDGGNRWAMVHVEDLALAYVKAIRARPRREVFNVTDRSRFTVREMAEAAARAVARAGDPAGADFGRTVAVPVPVPVAVVESWALAEARLKLGPYADALALDQHVDSGKAVRMLDWNPVFGGFADDAELYFGAYRHRRPKAKVG